MAALVEYLGLTQFVIAISIFLLASFSDIRIRKVSDVVWVTMGMLGLSIFSLIVAYDSSFHIIISFGMMPILGFFSYFLACEWVVDFHEKEVNLPWVLILIVSTGAVIIHPFFLYDQFDMLTKVFISYDFILILILFLSIFLFLEFYTFYLDYKYYKSNLETTKLVSKNEKKEKNAQSKYNSSNIASWILLILMITHLCATIISGTGEHVSPIYFGAFGALIPIIFLILYLLFFDWRIFPKEKNDNKTKNSKHDKKEKSSLEEEIEQEIIPRNRGFLEKITWSFLFIFGFITLMIGIAVVPDNAEYYIAILSVVVWMINFYALYNLGIPKGGADTKALLALTVLFPKYIFIEQLLINKIFFDLTEFISGIAYIFPFAFSVLINATVVTLIIPIALLIYNATKKDLYFPFCFFGYKMDLKSILDKHVWLMERIDDKGNIIKSSLTSSIEPDPETLKILTDKGRITVWVTPKIPFIVPMTIGFVINFLVGNLLFAIIFGLSSL
jgi:preflagellin peptidase FlaK